MGKFSKEFLKEIDRIIDYETTLFWSRKGKHLRGLVFGYDISREDVKQELWLRLIDFINKKFPDKKEEELLEDGGV